MHRHRGRPSVRMAELLVRAALSNFFKTERGEHDYDLSRLEDRDRRHPRSSDYDDLGANKFAFHDGHTFVEDQGNDFLEIVIELLKRFALAVRAGKARNVTDIEAGIRTMFNYGSKNLHRRTPDFQSLRCHYSEVDPVETAAVSKEFHT